LDEGLNIYAVSGYRSYSKQETIYNGNVSSMGQVEANKVSAIPGQSEHQTGLSMDVSCQSSGFDLVTAFGETEEGQWLAAHAHEYGFIIRYPKDKTEITQYSYEPWHIRYVGVTLATELYEKDITLDQFYEQLMI
ncbi:MAG: M15 family metallopeptidase, partial [Vallitaleaceae bacterium]|nr:M15 family metallopeptidase [Vallitaleaceae bacterium]